MLTQATGYIIAAVVSGGFSLLAIWYQGNKIHREVRTNHGKRAGERLEQLSDDVAQIKRTMVTQQDLQDHAAHDIEVANDLKKQNLDTRDIVLAAIQVGGN